MSREQGLISRAGSRIRGVHDLARPGVRFIHRQSRGEDQSVAEAVASGRADAGFGLRAEAARHKLAFTPLALERYFFACTKAALRGAAMKLLIEALRRPDLAGHISRLPGYDASRAGEHESIAAALSWIR